MVTFGTKNVHSIVEKKIKKTLILAFDEQRIHTNFISLFFHFWLIAHSLDGATGRRTLLQNAKLEEKRNFWSHWDSNP